MMSVTMMPARIPRKGVNCNGTGDSVIINAIIITNYEGAECSKPLNSPT